MKLSVEVKVAAAVAAGFMVMSSGAMAQGHKGQSAGSNHYGPANNPDRSSLRIDGGDPAPTPTGVLEELSSAQS